MQDQESGIADRLIALWIGNQGLGGLVTRVAVGIVTRRLAPVSDRTGVTTIDS